MARKFGVSMEDIQKLRQFQFFLTRRKLKAVDNMDFVAMVQLKCEKVLIPEITKISVVAQSIHMDDGSTVIPKCRIWKLIQENNNVIVKLKGPLRFLGSFLTFSFTHSNMKNEFLEAIGEIEDENYKSDDTIRPLT